MDGNSDQSVEIRPFRLFLSFYCSVFWAVCQVSIYILEENADGKVTMVL
jgi:hypothetical protein